ncbi:helix-turn-helix domain-containing protein [Bdellovibrio sp. HCB290]|uniref:helix-turn-helix domain-containing protein n=1 Tax=Bdellovibrio sp. HCB290 TaxID=3394356 RepID=UPI0039B582C9
MGSEFVEIDGDALKELLQSKQLSAFDLAMQLRVSSKTVQRWLNHTVLKVKPETIARIGEVLGVNPVSIRRDRPNLKIRPVNKSLAEFCSEKHFEQTRLKDSWVQYRQVLKGAKLEALPSEQQMTVCRYLGISSFYLGKFQSAKIYLNRSLEIAVSLTLTEERASILVWKGRLYETLGDFPVALSYLAEAEQLFTSETRLSIVAEHSYVLGRVHMHQDKNEEAIKELRRGILLSYRQQSKKHGQLIAWSYVMLAQLHFRLKDYANLEVTVRRLLCAAERLGWSRGILLACYYQGALASFTGRPMELSRKSFGRARATRKSIEIERYCPLLAQAEFVYFILNGRHQDAKAVMLERLHYNRHAEHLWASAVLDGMLLARLNPGMNTVRASMVQSAKQYFEMYSVRSRLDLLAKLENQSEVSINEISEYCCF